MSMIHNEDDDEPSSTNFQHKDEKHAAMNELEMASHPDHFKTSGTSNRENFSRVNPLSRALHTDLYQITMVYAYWKSGRSDENSVFDLFIRKNPFKGEYTIFAGLNEVIAFLDSFCFTSEEVEYLSTLLPLCDPKFFLWLQNIDCSKVKVYALTEGSVVFPHVPLLRVEGPLAVAQLLETSLLNLVNYPSLISTNAARYRYAAGKDKLLLEFGLRRAPGPDGGLSASRYTYQGGFDATSNALAGKMFGIPVRGTHAHSFVQSYTSISQVQRGILNGHDLVTSAVGYRDSLGYGGSNEGELAAFCDFALSFPDNFIVLLDTYNTFESGVRNFISVALALDDAGFIAKGVRLDSGDLAYMSTKVREVFRKASVSQNRPWLADVMIIVSNDINEDVLHSLAKQEHSIDAFGIGTHLVTCQAQPSLGGVYKLAEVAGVARMKISENLEKVNVPCRKNGYRLYGKDGSPILDLLQSVHETPPEAHTPILCKHPFESTKRLMVTPSRVKLLHELVWDGKPVNHQQSIHDVRSHTIKEVDALPDCVKRNLNPTSYKVSLSTSLFSHLHNLLETETPIKHFE